MDGLAANEAFLFEGFRLDRAEGCLVEENGPNAGEPLPLGSRALALLALLIERQGRLVTKDEIFASVWPGIAVEEANLTVQISALRRILDRDREKGSCIRTVAGRGYRFVAPVTATTPSTLPYNNGSAAPTPASPETTGPEQTQQRSPIAARPGRYRRWPNIIAMLAGGLCLIAAVVAAWSWRSASSFEHRVAPRLSIVVLPFANLDRDPDHQHFADALTEDLTSELARIEHMRVISHSTAVSYRDKPAGTKWIGRELGVRYVLEGGVQRSGEHIRVSSQLIDAASDTHLWADRFDRETGDIFALQNEIALRVANRLNATLEAVEARRRAETPDVLDYILRGRAAYRKWPMEESFVRAISSFERALALDSDSVEARTWLARVLVDRVLRHQTTTPAADIDRADKLVADGLAASPLNWHAHYVRGQVLSAQNRCEEAIAEYRTVIELNRTFQSAYADLGWCKFLLGSLDEVIPLQVQALRFHYAEPLLSVLHWRIGAVHLVQSHLDEAMATLEKARSINPRLVEAHSYLAAAYGLRDETTSAAAELAEARRFDRDGRYSNIAQLVAAESFGVPSIRRLFEQTYLVGLRKAGISEK